MNYIKIAIGLIVKRKKIYITQRKYPKNIWEFPGGKVKKNESVVDALKRELLEEVGIITLKFRFFRYIEYFSCNRKLKLYFFLIKRWRNRPYSREGHFYMWKFFNNLKTFDFLPANYNIILALQRA